MPSTVNKTGENPFTLRDGVYAVNVCDTVRFEYGCCSRKCYLHVYLSANIMKTIFALSHVF